MNKKKQQKMNCKNTENPNKIIKLHDANYY